MSKLDPDDPTVRTAVFGKQVEDFLLSDIGKYLVQRADDEAETLLKKLKVVSPNDANLVAQLQTRIKCVEFIKEWLAEAIHSGTQAMRVIEGEDA